MTTPTIQKRIARAIELRQIIANLETELKEIKVDLTAEAAYRTSEQTLTEEGGWSWRFLDANNNQVCVTQPADKLKAKIDPESKTFSKIKDAAGRSFMQLFILLPAYRPVEDFRKQAEAHLGRGAGKLIKLVTSESTITVSFEVAPKEAS